MRSFSDILAFLILLLLLMATLEDCSKRRKADDYNRKAHKQGLKVKKVFDLCNEKHKENKALHMNCLDENKLWELLK